MGIRIKELSGKKNCRTARDNNVAQEKKSAIPDIPFFAKHYVEFRVDKVYLTAFLNLNPNRPKSSSESYFPVLFLQESSPSVIE